MVRRSTRASDPLPGLLTVSNRIKARDHDKKVEISIALEILAPIVAPLEYLVLAASNLTGIQLFSELSFLTVNALFKAQAPLDPVGEEARPCDVLVDE